MNIYNRAGQESPWLNWIYKKVFMLIYAKKISPRLQYISNLMIRTIGRKEFILTNDLQEYNQYEGAKLNYSWENLQGGIQILPAGLLNEGGITHQDIEVMEWNGMPVFYYTEGAWPFDLFAAAFYLVSRYEEYIITERDAHGRFPATASLACRSGFLDQPVIDIWVTALFDFLKEHYPDFQVPERRMRFIPTMDVDLPYLFKANGLIRNNGRRLKHIFRGSFKTVFRSFGKFDPFDTYDLVLDGHPGMTPEFRIFVLMQSKGRYNPSARVASKRFQQLMKKLSAKSMLGLHPSYSSMDDPFIFRKELRRFKHLTGRPAERSRQHFLRFNVPATYNMFLFEELHEDYSMGYSTHPGFRAGTSVPFEFYLLGKEKTTGLRIFPFSIMDIGLRDHLRLDAGEAPEYLESWMNMIRKHGGYFIPVIHNDALSDYGKWKGWRDVWIEMIQKAAHDQVPQE